MDKLSGLASKLGGKGDSHQQSGGSSSGGSGQQEDYLDKGMFGVPGCFIGYMLMIPGLDSAEKKFGGGKVDTQKMRGTNEKITDTARDQFEKKTGYVAV